MQVMLDKDLAEIYGVELKRLNEQVKRNIERFPESFRFQLTKNEFENLRSQIATSNWGGRRYPPYVFTEQGISMLSAVLKSKTAIKVSIAIMNAFVEMRKFIVGNASIFQRIESIELKQLESDNKIEKIFKALENNNITPKQGIFFDGQIYDAYKFVSDIIRTAQESILIIDNYIDDTIVTLLSKKREKVNCIFLTKTISKQLKLDIEKFNQQYGGLTIKHFQKSHDRFIIIDNETVYHFGASLKDLGKKWFAFSKLDKESLTIINALKLNEK